MARRRAGRKCAVEALEIRALLAGDVVISEVMASSGASLLDEDQESSDWLELHNTTDRAIDLSGWYLTDDRRELTKWQFPAVNLQPDEYRVVFASGKDRAPLDGNLHTNFRLDADGEYTALVHPDGRTIEDAFDPGFPPQFQDVAYGRGAATRSVVVDGASTFRYWVPADGSLEGPDPTSPAWAQADFDDSSWSTGQAGFGFDLAGTQGVFVSPFLAQLTSGLTVAGQVSNLIGQAAPYLSPLPHTAQTVHSSVDETAGSWLGAGPSELTIQLLFTNTFDHLLLWNFSYFDPASGVDSQQGSGVKEFAVSFSADGVNYSAEQTFTTATPVVGQPVPLEQFYVGQQTARFVKLRTISAHNGALHGLGELALSRGALFDPDSVYDADYVATDLTSSLHDANRSSAYFRTSFDVNDAESVSTMLLRMRFDDGLIAYVNGVEVARANAPQSAVWNSSATANRPNHEAIEFAEYDLSAFRDLLKESGNVLAVHGLNATNDASNFLYHPELEIVGADPVTVGFLASPTPGQANAPRLGVPVHFSLSGGVLDQDKLVELSVDNAFDTIRYTTDGSDPDENSPIYTQPILLSTTTELKARSFTPGGTAGLLRREAFVKLADDLKSFSSNLPIFVIESFGGSIPAAATLRNTYSLVFDLAEGSGRAAVSDAPHYAGRSGMRQRGRSSAGFAQKQYKYETWDQDGNDADVPLLGLPSESDWVLNGPYTDKSLMRNAVTYKWWEDLGYYSPRTRFVEVFLNTDGDDQVSYADDYVGVYVLIEGIKIGENRVDIQTPEATTDISQITGGYVIEVGNPGQFTTSVSGRNIGYQYEDPGPRELNTAQRQWIRNYIEQFETALYSPDFTHPVTGKHYTQYIDVQSFVDYRIMREFTRNFDGGSTYFSIDRGGVMTMGPQWDLNWALGNVNYAEPTSVDRCGCDIEGWNYSYTTPTIPTWPAWAVRLQEDPDHWQLIVDRWHELRQTVLKDENFLADIDANFQLLAAEAADRNFQRWRTLGQNTVISPPGFRERDTYEKEVQYLRDWLVQHAAWLDQQFLPPPALAHAGGAVDAGFMLAIDSQPAPAGTKLIRQGDQARVTIATDDSLGASWTQLGFQTTDQWLAGNTGVGFDNSEGYKSITGLDIGATMRTSRSALLRMEFELAGNPLDVAALKLNMRYDDGFVAYLNGTEIARSESVTNGTPGSARSRTHEAYDFESFDVSQFKGLLQAGQNVLAIHGINASPASTDFLIIPELVAEFRGDVPGKLPIYYTTDGSDPRLPGGQINPAARIYNGPVRIDAETTLRARTWLEGTWSALVQGTYLVDTVPASSTNLRIAEVHFNPAPADLSQGELDLDSDQFEFIELVNIGSQSIDLGNVRLLEVDVDGAPQGVGFTFAVSSLAPTERIVVVKNQAAFASRYGSQIRVAGEFAGQLANGGERLTLVAADNNSIQSFTYDDAAGWPETPDGLGASLQAMDYLGDYNLGSNWRGSAVRHGTPGRREYLPGDANLDGKFNSQDLIEVLAAGKYEDSVADNASWLEGDWNGDREADSRDLVLALAYGNYSATNAVLPSLDDLPWSEIASAVGQTGLFPAEALRARR